MSLLWDGVLGSVTARATGKATGNVAGQTMDLLESILHFLLMLPLLLLLTATLRLRCPTHCNLRLIEASSQSLVIMGDDLHPISYRYISKYKQIIHTREVRCTNHRDQR